MLVLAVLVSKEAILKKYSNDSFESQGIFALRNRTSVTHGIRTS